MPLASVIVRALRSEWSIFVSNFALFAVALAAMNIQALVSLLISLPPQEVVEILQSMLTY